MKQPRCRTGIKVDLADGRIITRCRLKPGHNGPHEGRHLKSLPYQLIKWYKGDGREFAPCDRVNEYAWRARK